MCSSAIHRTVALNCVETSGRPVGATRRSPRLTIDVVFEYQGHRVPRPSLVEIGVGGHDALHS